MSCEYLAVMAVFALFYSLITGRIEWMPISGPILFVLVRKVTPDKVLEELEGFNGKVLKTVVDSEQGRIFAPGSGTLKINSSVVSVTGHAGDGHDPGDQTRRGAKCLHQERQDRNDH